MADQDFRSPARGDEAELFQAFNEELMRTISGSVFSSSPQVVEDACAFAWAKFVEYQPDRERNWRGWLFRTAQRQAWVLEREAREDRPLANQGASGGLEAIDQLQVREDVGEALSILSALPPRLRRIALLRALGFRYAEIGQVTGDSDVRVHQLVARANDEIREILAERAHATEQCSPRAERLWELEHEPPEWLVEKIGRVPRTSRRTAGNTVQRRAWRRAAMALDDYRSVAGP